MNYLQQITNLPLSEGKFDKGIMKAVFILGGPNVGKTTYAKKFNERISVHPKIYDADAIFEFLSTKHEIDISDDTTPETKQLYGKVRPLNTKQLNLWLNELLPLIVLLAPDDLNRLEHRISVVQKYGYDVKLIFIKPEDPEKIISTLSLRNRGVGAEYARRALSLTDDAIARFSKYNPMILPNVQATTEAAANKVAEELSAYYLSPVQNKLGRALLAKLHSEPEHKNIPDVRPKIASHAQQWYSKEYKK